MRQHEEGGCTTPPTTFFIPSPLLPMCYLEHDGVGILLASPILFHAVFVIPVPWRHVAIAYHT
eukprot:scaffold15510_cov26-Tisochrysis_lutea.AAC.2